jgi:hypothetical protein
MDCLPASLFVAVGDFNYRKRGPGSQVPRQGKGNSLTTSKSSDQSAQKAFTSSNTCPLCEKA